MTEENEFKKEVSLGDVVKLEPSQDLVGSFINIEQSTQYEDSWALRMRVDDKTIVTFVSKIVRDLIEAAGLTSGQRMKLLFVGMKKNQLGTREYKDYKLFLPK